MRKVGRIAPPTHTPGPWDVEQTRTTNWIGPLRASADGKNAIVVCFTDREGLKPEARATNDANAALIAAAPELLAACQRVVRLLEQQQDTDPLVDSTLKQTRAAIAKAEQQ